MSRKFLAFDVETAKQFPGDFSDWRQHRPLGICCAASIAGLTGLLAPELWARGEYDQVLQYVEQDARCTLELAEASERIGRLRWISRRGGSRDMPLPKSWLSVAESFQLPLPDTSWMTNPIQRERFTEWLG